MSEMRLAFLASAGTARSVLASSAVAGRWEEASALREWRVSGLAGHLARSAMIVEHRLQRTVPSDEMPVSAAAYYSTLLTTSDIHAPLHEEIRRRGEEFAQDDHATLVGRFDAALLRLRDRFADEPPDRLVLVSGDLVMLLDDYLATRIVELSVHTDDLCASVGQEVPALPAVAIAIATLVDVARFRHGDVAVLRALSRRERDPVDALRVL